MEKLQFRKDWKIWLLVFFLVLSIVSIYTRGLNYGIDFVGGTELKLELEKSGPEYISLTTDILKTRLNKLGLKSMQVLPEGDNKHITLRVSTTDPDELDEIKGILAQQAFFEQIVEGELCARGEEIALDLTGAQGAVFLTPGEGKTYNWRIFVKTLGDASARCGKVMKDKGGRPTDIFLDRPKDTIILMSSKMCDELRSLEQDRFGYSPFEIVTERARVPVVCYLQEGLNDSEIEETNKTVPVVIDSNLTEIIKDLEEGNKLKEGSLESVLSELDRYTTENRSKIMIISSEEDFPQELLEAIMNKSDASDINYTIVYSPKDENLSWYLYGDEENSWVGQVTGLKSSLNIQEGGLTSGAPIFNSVFTGSSPSESEARKTTKAYTIWLSSGNLPVKTKIVSESPTPAELGQRFLGFSVIIGLIAVILVALIITVRYREPRISGAIMLTGLSEITIILGFASLSGWQLDLAAVAGIIAAVGTGVDHQVVITDETMRGERRKEKGKRERRSIWDMKESINRAFFIIFTSAATIIAAMVPLFKIIDLTGFAFTTIIGVMVGIFITRPAFARILEKIL